MFSEELQEQYDGKLTREMSGSFYEVFSRVMRVLVGKKITVPGTFKRYVYCLRSVFSLGPFSIVAPYALTVGISLMWQVEPLMWT